MDQSEKVRDEMARPGRNDRVIEFPYLVMFRNEHGHFVSVGGGSEFKTEKETTAKAKEKCDELKMTVYVMEAVELYEPKKNNK